MRSRRRPSGTYCLGDSSVAASVPTAAAFAGPNAPRIAQFVPGADYTFADDADAQRAMTMAQQALEARRR